MTSIRSYFALQFTMLKRQLKDFGIEPLTACIIIAVLFTAGSYFLFYRSSYAAYIYVLTALAIVFRYNEPGRNDFLKFIYTKKIYTILRLAENLLTVLPFAIFLFFKQYMIPALVLLLLAAVASLFTTRNNYSFILPTPFYKRPFEFTAGFRTVVLVFILAYCITAIAVINQNFQLSLFTLLFIFLTCLSFYNEPEDIFYVWIHAQTVHGFLLGKIKTAILYATLLTLPVIVTLLIFFKNEWLLIAAVQLLGYIYLLAALLAKYSAFPGKIGLPQGILLVLSIIIPPMLLGTIPFFYLQSQKRLNAILT